MNAFIFGGFHIAKIKHTDGLSKNANLWTIYTKGLPSITGVILHYHRKKHA